MATPRLGRHPRRALHHTRENVAECDTASGNDEAPDLVQLSRGFGKKPPVGPLFGSVAAHTGVSTPSSTVREAPKPPISV